MFPQEGLEPEIFESLDFRFFFLQPKDGPEIQENTQQAIRYCLEHPKWRLSLQMHKIIGIPLRDYLKKGSATFAKSLSSDLEFPILEDTEYIPAVETLDLDSSVILTKMNIFQSASELMTRLRRVRQLFYLIRLEMILKGSVPDLSRS